MLDKRSKNGEQRVEARYSSKKEDNTEKKKDFIWEKEKGPIRGRTEHEMCRLLLVQQAIHLYQLSLRNQP
jgi:hypothetical protein